MVLKTKAKILLVDDDPNLLTLLSMRLNAAGYDVRTANDGYQCLNSLDVFEPDVLISDLKMDQMDGMELFDCVSQKKPWLPVIMITAHGTIPDAVCATQKGLFSFLPKPIERDALLEVIEKALLQSGASALRFAKDHQIITQNARFKELLKQARIAAKAEASILLQGPNGSGKLTLAKLIHEMSAHKGEKLKVFDTKLLSDEACELVDYFFELLSEGFATLYIPRIDELTRTAQTRLLGLMSEDKVRASIGKFRWIVASSENLYAQVVKDLFREDLYYRLNVVQIDMPSLEERKSDIPILVKTFIAEINKSNNKKKSFSPGAIDALLQASWPGNITQLKSFVERQWSMSQIDLITQAQVEESLGKQASEQPSLAEAKSEFERAYLIEILKAHRGNVTRAAKAAQRNRTDFYKLMARHNLQSSDFKLSKYHG